MASLAPFREPRHQGSDALSLPALLEELGDDGLVRQAREDGLMKSGAFLVHPETLFLTSHARDNWLRAPMALRACMVSPDNYSTPGLMCRLCRSESERAARQAVARARPRRVPYLQPGTKLFQEDIEAWEEYTGITLESGDALLLRTGRWALREELGPTRVMSGWDASVIPFMAERDIALLGADSVHEAPDSVPGLGFNPIHRFAIVARGMNLLDNLDLEDVAEVAASLNRWEFMLVVAPLRVPGGTGSPVNPIAIF